MAAEEAQCAEPMTRVFWGSRVSEKMKLPRRKEQRYIEWSSSSTYTFQEEQDMQGHTAPHLQPFLWLDAVGRSAAVGWGKLRGRWGV